MRDTSRYLLVLLFSMLALPCKAGATKHSVGFGIQYGGIAGWQVAEVSNSSVSRLSVGAWGVTVGHDRFLSSNVAFGASAFANVFLTGASLNVNYYMGQRDSGFWVLGLDLFRAKELLDGVAGAPIKGYENNAFFSLGYSF